MTRTRLHVDPGGTARRTITSQNQELLLSIKFVCGKLRVRSDNLLFGTKGMVLLEFEITNRSGQCQIACIR